MPRTTWDKKAVSVEPPVVAVLEDEGPVTEEDGPFTEELSPEELERRQREKDELLASLQSSRPSAAPKAATKVPTADEPSQPSQRTLEELRADQALLSRPSDGLDREQRWERDWTEAINTLRHLLDLKTQYLRALSDHRKEKRKAPLPEPVTFIEKRDAIIAALGRLEARYGEVLDQLREWYAVFTALPLVSSFGIGGRPRLSVGGELSNAATALRRPVHYLSTLTVPTIPTDPLDVRALQAALDAAKAWKTTLDE